jgi:hypothetical protein
VDEYVEEHGEEPPEALPEPLALGLLGELGQGEPHVPHGQGEPHVPHGQGEPHVPHGQGEPHVPHGQGEPHVPHGQAEPVELPDAAECETREAGPGAGPPALASMDSDSPLPLPMPMSLSLPLPLPLPLPMAMAMPLPEALSSPASAQSPLPLPLPAQPPLPMPLTLPDGLRFPLPEPPPLPLPLPLPLPMPLSLPLSLPAPAEPAANGRRPALVPGPSARGGTRQLRLFPVDPSTRRGLLLASQLLQGALIPVPPSAAPPNAHGSAGAHAGATAPPPVCETPARLAPSAATCRPEACVGHTCRVYWQSEGEWYDADVAAYDPSSRTHLLWWAP